VTVFLWIALLISLALNGWLWYRWHSYRARPAGSHSHTGMMPVITSAQVKADKRRR
jgi:hypothetical protein